MPVGSSKSLDVSGRRDATPKQIEDFAIALCKLNLAGDYHPDILDWPRPAYQNLMLTTDGTPRLTAIDIDQTVLSERCTDHQLYGYHAADQWLWLSIAARTENRSLHQRAYPQSLSPVSHNPGVWLDALVKLRA